MAIDVRPIVVTTRFDPDLPRTGANAADASALVLRYTVPCANVPQEARTYAGAPAMSKHPLTSLASITRVQVPPLFVERYSPARVAARTVVPLGSTLTLFTKLKLVFAVLTSWFQLVPPSIVLKIPAPRTASLLNTPSPVPA